ncbi:MAG: ferritin-like domain-containing protein [Mycobacteriales bacterium]
MHSSDVFRHYERNHWRLSDLDFGGIRRDLVRPEYVTMARSSVMGESNVIAAVHGFLNEFVDDYDFSSFAVVWGYQEVQHHNAFRGWLRELDADVADAPVEAMREPYAPGTTPSATLATNIISELTVNHVYKSLSRYVQEPVLRQLLSNASRDEAAHAREFIHYCRERLRRHPEELPSVLETLYVYTADTRIKHPVSMFKDNLAELRDHETIGTGFELFLGQVADAGELAELQGKIRKTFAGLTELDLSSNSRVRRALAEQLA